MADTPRKVRFAALMDLRRRHEDECRRTVGRLERERADLVAAREAVAAERDAAARQPIPPALHEVFGAYWRRMAAELARCDQRIAAQDAAIAKARAELVEAHRETVVIGKLQDLDRIAIARAADRRERRRLDEFAASRFAATAGGATL